MRLGLILIAIAAATAIPLYDDDVNRSIAENSSCNERECTESETRIISAVITGALGIPGVFLLLRGVGMAIRGRDSLGTAGGMMSGAGLDDGAREMAELAELDARYSRGGMTNDAYTAERRQILGEWGS